MVFLFVTTTVLHAQDSGWTVNEPDYQYDMTAYIELSLGGAVVDDYSNYEVGAFVGNECRGVAKVDSKIIMVLKELILKQETDKMDNKTILMVQMVYPVEKELLHKSYRTKQENLEKLLLM